MTISTAEADLAIQTDGPHQALPRPDGRRRRRPRRSAGRGVRLPRPERLRQDHDDPDAARPAARRPSGEARVLGSPMPRALDAVLPRVGALVEGPAFSPFLTGEQNLRRFDAADRHSPSATREARVATALERVGLSNAAKKKAHAYSLGMKQRLGLANALLMPRELLVLDEPTNGLDPQGTREVRALIRSFAADGTTVFVSSHLLAEVEQLCTHVGVMSGGRLVAQGTLEDFRRSGGRARVEVRTPDLERRARRAARARRSTSTAGMRHPISISSPGVLPDEAAPEEIVAALVRGGRARARLRGRRREPRAALRGAHGGGLRCRPLRSPRRTRHRRRASAAAAGVGADRARCACSATRSRRCSAAGAPGRCSARSRSSRSCWASRSASSAARTPAAGPPSSTRSRTTASSSASRRRPSRSRCSCR